MNWVILVDKDGYAYTKKTSLDLCRNLTVVKTKKEAELIVKGWNMAKKDKWAIKRRI